MTVLQALLLAQPAVAWLAAGALLVAAAIAFGQPRVMRAAAAGPLAALVAAAAPRAHGVQAAAFLVAAAALALLGARGRSLRTTAAPVAAEPAADEAARLIGRTVRALAFHGRTGEVEVDGRPRPARLADDAPAPLAASLLRVVRVSEGELVVRPVP